MRRGETGRRLETSVVPESFVQEEVHDVRTPRSRWSGCQFEVSTGSGGEGIAADYLGGDHGRPEGRGLRPQVLSPYPDHPGSGLIDPSSPRPSASLTSRDAST